MGFHSQDGGRQALNQIGPHGLAAGPAVVDESGPLHALLLPICMALLDGQHRVNLLQIGLLVVYALIGHSLG